MTCYRDMTFCSAELHLPGCTRALTDEVRAGAAAWWERGGGDPAEAPIAVSDFCTPRLADEADVEEFIFTYVLRHARDRSFIRRLNQAVAGALRVHDSDDGLVP